MSKTDVSGIVVEAEPSQQYSAWHVSAYELSMYAEKFLLLDIHRCLLNIYRDHTVDVSS